MRGLVSGDGKLGRILGWLVRTGSFDVLQTGNSPSMGRAIVTSKGIGFSQEVCGAGMLPLLCFPLSSQACRACQ